MTESYEVGYKKPPKSSQWQPGQSGNPLGKKKQKKLVSPLSSLFVEELAKPIDVKVGGKTQKISKGAALAASITNQLLKAEAKDMPKLLQMLEKLGVFQLQHEKFAKAQFDEDEPLTEAEIAILERTSLLLAEEEHSDKEAASKGLDHTKGSGADDLDLANGMICESDMTGEI